ncbi:MAG: hypothetical protein OSJ76_08570 [Alphaproteobacteria bacterium]|nr:hypothetical protein [Alphaproteobacteria bacterium]
MKTLVIFAVFVALCVFAVWRKVKSGTASKGQSSEEEYLVLAIRENFFSKEIDVTLNRRLQDIYHLKRAKETIDLESYRICKFVETFNFLCSMINQNPFLAQKLCQVPKEEAVMILQKAASLSDKQISDNKNLLNHIITIVSSK